MHIFCVWRNKSNVNKKFHTWNVFLYMLKWNCQTNLNSDYFEKVCHFFFCKNACSVWHTSQWCIQICLATVELCVFCAYGFGCTHFLDFRRISVKKLKRIFSLVLSLIMLLSVTIGFDFSTYAMDATGQCGENVDYTFDLSFENFFDFLF